MPDAYLPRFLSREGLILPGEKRSIPVASPAGGGEWSQPVPGGRQWRLLGGSARLTTGATVANRFGGLVITGDRVLFLSSNSGGIPANSQQVVTYQPTENPNGNGAINGQFHPTDIPNWWLPPGTTVSSFTSGVIAGDAYDQGVLLVEEVWLDDQELTKLHEEKLAALGVEQLPWGSQFTGGS